MNRFSLKKITVGLFLSTSFIFLSGCLNDSLDDLSLIDTNTPTGTVTYTANVQAILSQQCTSCHGSVNPSAGLDLSSYTRAKSNVDKIISRIDLQTGQSGIMPPSGRMAESYIQTIKNWKTQGLLEQ